MDWRLPIAGLMFVRIGMTMGLAQDTPSRILFTDVDVFYSENASIIDNTTFSCLVTRLLLSLEIRLMVMVRRIIMSPNQEATLVRNRTFG